jgi:hypothetical protein
MKKSYLSLRNIVLAFSLVASLLSLSLLFNEQFGLCHRGDITCSWKIGGYGADLFIFIPIFIFALITYFMNGRVRKAWSIFSMIWAPIVVYVLYLTTSEAGGSFGGLHDAYNGIIILGLFALYPIVSLLLIAWKYWRLRSK